MSNKTKVKNVIQAFEEGETIKKACRDNDISTAYFFKLLHSLSGLKQRYERAKAAYADIKVSELIAISDDKDDNGNPKNTDPNRLKVQIDTIKWVASKYLPKVYGERLDLTIHENVNIRAAIDRANGRVIDAKSRRITQDVVLSDEKRGLIQDKTQDVVVLKDAN